MSEENWRGKNKKKEENIIRQNNILRHIIHDCGIYLFDGDDILGYLGHGQNISLYNGILAVEEDNKDTFDEEKDIRGLHSEGIYGFYRARHGVEGCFLKILNDNFQALGMNVDNGFYNCRLYKA